jgi:tetratricopeptide (TPR) repeat protein
MMKEDRHLQASIGYLELGMIEEANNEIECLPPEMKNSSAALGVRLEIYRAAEKWVLMEVVARELWKRHQDQPVYWNDLAWATRRAVGIEKAFEILSQAVQKFTEDAMTNYNIGCYLSQMGEIGKAKEHVGKAIKLDDKFKLLALDDLDLEPLWLENWKASYNIKI